MSELRAQNFMALDAPCEDKLSTMVTEYNKLADQWTVLRSQLAEREAEVERLRQGLLQCATEAGEDVSDGIPGWPDVVDWAVRAVKETRAEGEEETDRLSAEVKRLREALQQIADGQWNVDRRWVAELDVREFARAALTAWHTATGGTSDALSK